MTTKNTPNAAERPSDRNTLIQRLMNRMNEALDTCRCEAHMSDNWPGTFTLASAVVDEIDRSETEQREALDSHHPAESVSAAPAAVPGAVWIYGSVSLVAHGSEEEWVRKRNAARLYLCPQPSTPGAVSDEAIELFKRACEVVHHDADCPAIGGNGDGDCTCDAVPFLNDLESFAKRSVEAKEDRHG